jgi:hypothetical protein
MFDTSLIMSLFKIEAYIDPSIVIHDDSKSHTGVVARIGGVGVFLCIKKAEVC